MNLLLMTIYLVISSSVLLMLSPSLPLQAMALLLMSGATATIMGSSISILLGIYTILIYSSGLLVLLAYFVALTPDQTLNTPTRSSFIFSSLVIILIIAQSSITLSYQHLSNPLQGNISVITILTPSSGSLLTMIALMLVLTMVAVVKVSSMSSGPIRPWS